jgi:soluble lytic murein transglycosylase-like protein
MKKHLLTILISAAAMVASRPAMAQSVVESRDAFGHLVLTEGDEQKPKPQPATAVSATPSSPTNFAATSRYTGLVYWSNREHRWKPVPQSGSSTMKAARKAAQEVDAQLAGPDRSSRLVIGSPVTLDASGSGLQRPMSPEAVDKAIDEAAQRHGVDPNLVRAVVKVESNFNPHAVSSKGAMGLMQLMPYTAKSLKVGDAFDPNQNVDAGVRHLKSLLENYNGNLEMSLAAYNAGSGAVRRSRGIPPYRETRDYVKKITDLYLGGAFKPRIQETRDAEGHRNFSNIE